MYVNRSVTIVSAATFSSCTVGVGIFIVILLLIHPPLEWLAVIVVTAIALVPSVIVGLITYSVADAIGLIGVAPQQVPGVVTAKYYTPSRTSMEHGYARGSNGRYGPVMTTTPEAFTIEIVLEQEGKKIRLPVKQENFDELNTGERVSASYRISRYSGKTRWGKKVFPLV